MELNNYQEKIKESSSYSDFKISGLLYTTLNLSSSSGLFVNKIKTILEEKDGKIHPNDKSELVKVLGEVLACISNVADELFITLEDVAMLNIQNTLNIQSNLKQQQSIGNKKRI